MLESNREKVYFLLFQTLVLKLVWWKPERPLHKGCSIDERVRRGWWPHSETTTAGSSRFIR